MDENINIAEILKDVPKGTKLYSPICGECTFFDTSSEAVICSIDDNYIAFDNNGHFLNYPHAECVLFPSKNNRDWSTFKTPCKHKHFEPFQKILIVCRDIEGDDVWMADLYSHCRNGYHYTTIGVGLSDDEIIPFESNEDKLGKPLNE